MITYEPIKIDFRTNLLKYSSFLSLFDRESLLKELDKLDYQAIYENHKLARFESHASINVGSMISNFITDILAQLEEYYKSDLKVEHFVFKYVKDCEVPWHVDKPRHYFLSMLYLGDFSGGSYIYKGKDENEYKISLQRGDLLLSVNKNQVGENCNTEHMVSKISSGIRYVIASTFVKS